jgi:hypothetical protein
MKYVHFSSTKVGYFRLVRFAIRLKAQATNLDGRMAKLRRVLRHPGFHLPNGKVSNGSDFTINKKLERGEVFAYDAYAFNEDYERVSGRFRSGMVMKC